MGERHRETQEIKGRLWDRKAEETVVERERERKRERERERERESLCAGSDRRAYDGGTH